MPRRWCCSTRATPRSAKDIVFATLGGPGVTIPVVSIAYDDGVALESAPAGSVDVAVDAETFAGPTENIIAELPGKNPDNVVMLGAHLDSVIEGPGVQDNGSGSAAILAIAEAMAGNKKYVPENTVRFAWWADEEQGLNGSFEYFTNADFGLLNTPEEVDKIAGYLNFDMIASPNFVYGVYDADESSFAAPGRRSRGFRGDRGPVRGLLHDRGRARTTTPSSPDAPTTRCSSCSTSPPAACSPAPSSSRPPSR